MASISQFFQNLFAQKSESVIGIDISSSAVKVVQLGVKGGQPSLETYGEIALGPYAGAEIGESVKLPTEKIVEAVGDILREAKVTTKDAGVAIPMSSSLLRLVDMPALPDEKLKKMIPLEIRKYVPVPISEVMLDWWVIPKEKSPSARRGKKEEETVEVLVVAIHNEIINRYRDIMKKTGLTPGFFEIEIFSTLRAVLDRSPRPQMIIDMGAATTKVYVVERGVIRSSHIVNSGSQDITEGIASATSTPKAEAEEQKRKKGIKGIEPVPGSEANPEVILENLLFEAKRVKLNFERKSGKKIEKAIYTGGGSILADLERRATEAVELPTEIADPFSRVEAPSFLRDLLKEVGPEFCVAIGAALRRLEGK